MAKEEGFSWERAGGPGRGGRVYVVVVVHAETVVVLSSSSGSTPLSGYTCSPHASPSQRIPHQKEEREKKRPSFVRVDPVFGKGGRMTYSNRTLFGGGTPQIRLDVTCERWPPRFSVKCNGSIIFDATSFYTLDP